MLVALLLALSMTGQEVTVTTSSEEARRLFELARDRQMELDATMGETRDTPAVLEPLHRALALDPGFAQAHVWIGRFTTAKDALAHLDRAEELAAALPAPERMLIEELAAERRGEEEKSRRLLRGLAEAAPDDWRVRLRAGIRALRDHRSEAALLHLQRTIALNPRAARAWNSLGYVFAGRRDFRSAVEALEHYIALRPREANARDTLGDVLLYAGRYGDSEKAYLEAVRLDPKFWVGWLGVAQARFCLERWEQGRAAATSAVEAAPDVRARHQAQLVHAFSFAAEGRGKEALAELGALERGAEKVPLVYALSALEKGELLLYLARPDEASSQADSARDRADEILDPEQRLSVERRSLLLQLRAAIARGTLREAAHALAELDEHLVHSPSNVGLRASLHAARGELLLARKEPRAALGELQQCVEEDGGCRLLLARAQEALGDPAAATATRASILSSARRDPVWRGVAPTYLLARAEARRALPASAPPGAER